jgi:hypothetical protein
LPRLSGIKPESNTLREQPYPGRSASPAKQVLGLVDSKGFFFNNIGFISKKPKKLQKKEKKDVLKLTGSYQDDDILPCYHL